MKANKKYFELIFFSYVNQMELEAEQAALKIKE